MKYSLDKVKEICNHIRSGLSAKDASVLSDINEDTFYTWKKGKSEFSEAIKKADIERKESLIQNIRKDHSWQSKAWLLERLYRDEFAAQNIKEILDRISNLELLLDKLKI